MDFLKSLVRPKNPASSKPATQGATQASFGKVNPITNLDYIKNSKDAEYVMEDFIKAYKLQNQQPFNEDVIQIWQFVKNNPMEAIPYIESRLDRRSYSDISTLSDDEIEDLREVLTRPYREKKNAQKKINQTVSTLQQYKSKNPLKRPVTLKTSGGKRKTRKNRKMNRKTRRN